jgi:hypothetical protein
MKVFIGSSSEQAIPNGLLDRIANIVQECGKIPIKWNKKPSIFRASKSTLENLDEIPTREHIGASIFICTPDDETDYRGKKIETPSHLKKAFDSFSQVYQILCLPGHSIRNYC